MTVRRMIARPNARFDKAIERFQRSVAKVRANPNVIDPAAELLGVFPWVFPWEFWRAYNRLERALQAALYRVQQIIDRFGPDIKNDRLLRRFMWDVCLRIILKWLMMADLYVLSAERAIATDYRYAAHCIAMARRLVESSREVYGEHEIPDDVAQERDRVTADIAKLTARSAPPPSPQH